MLDNEKGEAQIALASVTLPIITLPAGDLLTLNFSRVSTQTPRIFAASSQSCAGREKPRAVPLVARTLPADPHAGIQYNKTD